MEIFKTQNLSFTYPESKNKTLDDISVSINKGEFVCLCGQSGCGKTTFLRLLKTTLSPTGNLFGSVEFSGKKLSDTDIKTQTEKIGFVMQDVENQIVTDKVWHELAFGLESLGYKTSEIRKRVSEMASFFGIDKWFHKSIEELSGGQKQLLNLASVMVMQPDVLILDEPTAQLDPIAAMEFLKTLQKINQELGTTIILSEHRMEEALAISERVIVMDLGKIIADGTPKETGKTLKDMNHPMFRALPTPMRVYGGLCDGSDYPVTVKDGRIWLEAFANENDITKSEVPRRENNNNTPFIEIKNVWFRYEKNSADVLKGINLTINKGEIFSVLGGNGAGKSTLLSVISGLSKPYSGAVYINKQKLKNIDNLYKEVLGVLFQNPKSLFLKTTVIKELEDVTNDAKKIEYYTNLCKIGGLYERHPYDLSGGEQQRLALCKVLLKEPEILLLDEPTKGFDAEFKEIFAEILFTLKKSGKTIIMVSHDIEFCAYVSDRCTMLFDGIATVTAEPREFFCGNTFYTTSANRMARDIIKNPLLADDIISAFGGNVVPKKRKEETELLEITKSEEPKEAIKAKKRKEKLSKKSLVSMLLLLISVTATVFLGNMYLEDKRYYFISLLIILETMLATFFSFEGKKPGARKLVVISVLCAIAAGGRIAFTAIPLFKPILAIIIISGVCLGAETGFLVGAISAFVSNFFFGQGPWTPWQMFIMGVVGFVAGIVFYKFKLKRNRIILAVFGFLVTVFVYGVIMNGASIFMMHQQFTLNAFFAACALGFPLDVVHGASTAFFLFFIAVPIIKIIDRIKEKYGI